MSILSEQLEAIFLEIKANFGQHRQIQVTPLTGSPPEQYRIQYHLQGLCKKAGGEVQTCTDHRITLTLPFGFPHFPPNCKPESPVFHPDFDEAAICISEFWESNQSLSGLIVHIGRMLCGEIYSTTNAFNEEAAAWYQENREKLPLDTVEPASPGFMQPPPEQEEISVSQPLTVDIVDDILFPHNEKAGDEIDALTDSDSTLMETTAEKAAKTRLSLEDSSPAHDGPVSLSGLNAEAQHKLNEARKKHQEGEAFEHQGQPARALERYQTVKSLAPDFPEIDKDISRAQYSVEMLGGWETEDLNQKDDTDKIKNKKKPAAKAQEPAVQREHEPPPSRRPVRVLAIGAAGSFLILTGTYLYFNAQFNQTYTMVEECKQFLDTGRFREAEEKCNEALEQVSKVHLIRQEEKDLVITKTKAILESKKLQEGLALSSGTDLSTLPKWQESLKIAGKHLADGQWQEALIGYTHTLRLVSEIPSFDHAIVDQIHNNMATAQFNIALQAGEQAQAAAEWQSAKNHFIKAMDIARTNPHIPPANISRIKTLIALAELNSLINSGEQYFAKGDWANALAAFEQAQEKEQTIPPSERPAHSSLQENIIRTKIFNALEQGKKAFTDAQWDQAIGYYENAIHLLEENSEILRRDNPVQSQQKIARLMLHAAIIRDKQRAAGHLKNKEFSEGIKKLQAVIETITKSPFSNEQEFQSIIKETRVSVNQAQEEFLITEHIAYLTSNYQKLFIKNNPALSADSLVTPRASFLKKIGNKSLYKVQCFEEGHGRPVLLQANFIYDPATNNWRFYGSDTSANEQQAEIMGQKILTAAYQAQEKRLIEEQTSYLKENFQALFIKVNPDLLPENLSNPEVIFQKKIGSKLLFLLQCLSQESNRSTPLKTQYIYDPAKALSKNNLNNCAYACKLRGNNR